jgi:serine/threonine-protein kinase
VAYAQATGAEKMAAEALFGEGKRLMDQGKFADACPKFADSQKLDPGVGTLLNLARCYQKNGQAASAWSTYKEAAAAARTAGQADREGIARREAAALEPTLPKLTVSVSPETASLPNLEVRMDGVILSRGLWGVAAPVDPGPHNIEAKAAGKRPFSQRVQAALKSSSAVTIPSLGTGSSSEPAAAAVEPSGPVPAANTTMSVSTSSSSDGAGKSPQRAIGIVIGGAGVVAMAVGGVLALSAKSAYDGVPADQCDATGCTETGFQTRTDARDKAGMATIVFGVGAAALVGGGILFLTAPSSSGSPSASLSVGPSGFAVRGSF